ncbi:MAG TPA: class I SAM-dependent methyltransferase [Thermoanaerobaculia bacterium]|nr:class I SAM-dependent methyltransferase [Thermoanaerobaculia bacterium]
MRAPSLRLHHRAERSLTRRHPWIFSGGVAEVRGEPAVGETVEVLAPDGESLALAAYSPHSQIRARVWSFDPEVAIDEAFFRHRLERAIAARGESARAPDGGCRLVYAESDGLPGLIVDRYGEFAVCQFLSAGAERWRDAVTSVLVELLGPRGLWERSDVGARRQEGLDLRAGCLAGEEPPERIEIDEDGLRLLVDVRQGHKTGTYLDQRPNRLRFRSDASGREVLDVFAFTGGFSLAALAGGAASVMQVEDSAAALQQCLEQAAANGFDADRLEQAQGNAFSLLRRLLSEGRRFDAIVLDPPKFVTSRGRIEQAARGYKDINRLSFLLLRPGGLLYTFSCSGLLEPALFQKIVADAALDARVEAQIVERLGQAPDHPTLLSFPEATYLKGFVCRVLSSG